MTAEQILALNKFERYSFGDKGIRRWASGRSDTDLNFELHQDTVMESYHMAIEYFLKSVVSNSTCYSHEHSTTHNLVALARDIEFPGRNKYHTILRMFTDYYRDGRYERDDKVAYRRIIDYLEDKETYDEVDKLLFELYTLAVDTARSKRFATNNVNKLSL